MHKYGVCVKVEGTLSLDYMITPASIQINVCSSSIVGYSFNSTFVLRTLGGGGSTLFTHKCHQIVHMFTCMHFQTPKGRSGY